MPVSRSEPRSWNYCLKKPIFRKIVGWVIAESLGLGFRFDSKVDAGDLKRAQAERKAKKLVALVQGTSALEGQAVDENAVESMVEQTTHELLAGSKRKLWSEE